MPGQDVTCVSSQDKLCSFDRTKLPPEFHSKTQGQGSVRHCNVRAAHGRLGEALTANHEARVARPPRPSSLVPRRTPTVDSHTPNGRLQTGIYYIQSLLCLQGLSTDPLITGDCVAKNLRDPVSQPRRKNQVHQAEFERKKKTSGPGSWLSG